MEWDPPRVLSGPSMGGIKEGLAGSSTARRAGQGLLGSGVRWYTEGVPPPGKLIPRMGSAPTVQEEETHPGVQSLRASWRKVPCLFQQGCMMGKSEDPDLTLLPSQGLCPACASRMQQEKHGWARRAAESPEGGEAEAGGPGPGGD